MHAIREEKKKRCAQGSYEHRSAGQFSWMSMRGWHMISKDDVRKAHERNTGEGKNL